MLKNQHHAKKLAGIGLRVKYFIEGMKRDLELAKRQLAATLVEAARLAGEVTTPGGAGRRPLGCGPPVNVSST